MTTKIEEITKIPLFLDVEDNREAFYEGAFLNMLFKKLQRLLDQVLYATKSCWLCGAHNFFSAKK